MHLIDIVGWTAAVITLVYTALGLPMQIRKNSVNKSTKGLSLFMTALMFLTFSSWVVYAILKRDWYILAPNFVGAVGVFVILVQFWLYRVRD